MPTQKVIPKITQQQEIDMEKLFESLINKVKAYDKKADLVRIEHAYKFAYDAHSTQFRDSGKPYISHPVEAAIILTQYKADEDSIISCLLHDTIEDCESVTEEKVEKEFGPTILRIVSGVTKVDHLLESEKGNEIIEGFYGKQKKGSETLRKIFEFAKDDYRILVVKLADRMHNIRTLGTKKGLEKRRLKAIETIDIFGKVASRFGISEMQREFEELCYPYVYPEIVLNFKKKQKDYESQINESFDRIKNKIKKGLLEEKCRENLFEISMRRPSFKRIEKLFSKGMDLRIDNFLNFNIVVKKRKDCYFALSLIHKIWKSIGKENDYISSSPDNGYKAYHTKVIGGSGYILSFYIMTEEMKSKNKYGIIHDIFSKKDNFSLSFMDSFDKISSKTKKNSYLFYEGLKKDILEKKIKIHINEDEIFIPSKSTGLDAIIHYYHDKADFINKIYINNIDSSFSSSLSNNDRVEASFGDKVTLNFDWFHIVSNVESRIFITENIKKLELNYRVKLGRQVLQKAFDIGDFGNIDKFLNNNQSIILSKLNIKSIEELLMLIGDGEIRADSFINKFVGNYKVPIFKKIFNIFDKTFNIVSKGKREHARFEVELMKEGKTSTLNLINKAANKSSIDIVSLSTENEKDDSITSVKILNCSTLDLDKAKDNTGFYKFYTRMSAIEGILSIKPLMSLRKIKVFKYVSLLSIFMVLIFPMIFDYITSNKIGGIYNKGWLALGFLPILYTNYIFYSFVRNNFPRFRNTKKLIASFIGFNFVSYGIFISVLINLVDMEYNFVNIPLSIGALLIISLLILMEYNSRKIDYDNDIKETMTKQDWEKKKKDKIIGYSYRIIAVLIWSLMPIVIKYYLGDVDNFTITGMSIVIGLIILLPYIFFKIIIKIKNKTLFKNFHLYFSKLLIVTIIFNGLLSFFYYYSLKFTSASTAILFLNFAPVFSLSFAILFFRKKIIYLQKKKDVRNILWVFIIGTLGTILLVLNKGGFNMGDIKLEILGMFLAFLATIFDALFIVTLILYTKSKNVLSGIKYLTIKLLVLSLFFLPIVLNSIPNYDFSLDHKLGFFYIGVISLIAYYFSYESYKRVDGFINHLLFNFAPLITFSIEIIFFDLQISFLFILGGILILGSSIAAEWINTKSEKKLVEKIT